MDAQLRLQLRLWQQQPSKQVLEALLASIDSSHITSSSSNNREAPLGPASQAVLLAALASPLSQLLPPNRQYVARLAKQLIQAVEAAGHELGEELLQLYTSLLQVPEEGGTLPWRYQTFYYSSSPSWQQLQDLQQQHVARCLGACQQPYPRNDKHEQLQQQQQQQRLQCDDTEGWQGLMPLAQLKQLQAGQQLMSELVLAAGQVQLEALSKESQQQHEQQAIDKRNQQIHGQHVQHQQQQRQQANDDHQKQKHRQHLQEQHQQQSSGNAHDLPHCRLQQDDRQAQQQQQQRHCAGLVSVHMSANLFEGGTGCHMWDAGFLLAEWLLNHQQLIAGKTCIELGCGPGLVAACLARLQPARLLLTDGDPQTLVNCCSNLALNGHSVRLLGSWQQGAQLLEQQQQQQRRQQEGVSRQNQLEPEVLACPLDWSADVPGLCADVVLGSDILYDPAAVPSVVRLLTQLLGAHSAPGAAASSTASCSKDASADVGADAVLARRRCSAAYLSTTRRQASTLQLFETAAREHGLQAQELPMQPSSWRGASGSGSSSDTEQAAMFQELPALNDRDNKYILHRVTAF